LRKIIFAGIAEGNFGLAAVNPFAGAVAVVVPVAAHVARTVGEAAPLTPGIQRIGALRPAAEVPVGVTLLCFLATLNLGLRRRFFL
jgi:hypothetical protein